MALWSDALPGHWRRILHDAGSGAPGCPSVRLAYTNGAMIARSNQEVR
jgi:hypothetical protein